MKAQTKHRVRLTTDVVPSGYEIHLKPDLEAFVFEGEETVHLYLKKPSKTLTLHSVDLEIESAEVIGVEFAEQITYDEKAETATFVFKNNLPKDTLKLKVLFRGILNDRMHGFYRSSFQHEGKTKHIATTQFESTDARRAFPCFDEPAMKASFEISLTVPSSHAAISNTMPTEIKEHEAGFKTVSFAPSPLMSTYLLAFIVGDFEHIEKRTKDGVLVRVFVTPGKKKQAEFALDCAVKIVSFFNTYFDIPYPLPVLDMIAIPDFSAGAMENWGAITYRESALLVDAINSSTHNRQWVALVIAHEIAHQWFGNLVTMEWWTHLWLNEVFASYIESLAVDHIFPKWDIWTQFVYSDLSQAMSLDSLKNTHAIEVEVHHPSEIGEIFDAVSYSKGASVIRMIADYLGEKDFRDGLRHYLKKHHYGNASTKDLWLALEHVSDKPVRSIMDNWTSKPGFPVVIIENDRQKIRLTQSRFFSSSIAKKSSKDKTIWKVPINIKRESKNRNQEFLLDKKSKSIDLSLKAGEWIYFNSGSSGMYRLNYPEVMLRNLEEAVKRKSIPARDRFSIQDDAFALSESGEFFTVPCLELARSYKNEDDYTVWASLISNLETVKDLTSGASYPTLYSAYMRDILSVIATKVGWEAKRNESHTTPMLRSLVLSVLGYSGDRQTIKRARKLFEALKKGKSLNPDLKGVVYGLVARNGGVKEYEWFLRRHEEESLQEEKNRLLFVLACFENKKLIKRALEYSFSERVRPQDTYGVFSYAWGNRFGRDIVWEFTKSHWDEILKRYGKGGHMLPRFIQPAGFFASNKKAEEVRRFFRVHKAPGAERAVEQAIEKIYSNAAWLKRDKRKIINWLRSNS